MPSTGHEPSILVVDDDTATRELVAAHLRREGFDVREAASGEAALELMAGQAIGLVILDMGLPGMSGLDVVRTLREQPKTAPVPIMVLTGKGVEYPLATSLGVGADDYLTKPIRLDDLAARVRARLRSQRVATEQALRKGAELYRALVEQSADGILVSDQTGRYVEANPAICRMLGYSRDELLAMFTPSLRADDDPLTPEDMDVRLAETAAGAGLLVERRYRRKDGTSLPAEVSFSQLPEGRLQRNIRDITARKRAEAEQARLAAAVEQAADYVIVNDRDGIVQTVNPAFERLTRYPAGEAIGRSIAGLLRSGVDPPEVYVALDAAIARGDTWTGRLFERRADGGLVEVDLSVSPIRDATGALIGSVEIGRDQTRERELEAEHEREAQIRVALAESLAHIPADAPLEQAAQSICDELVRLPFVDVAEVEIFLDDRGVEMLAVAAPPGYPAVAGTRLPAAGAARVRERCVQGPWAGYVTDDPADGFIPGVHAAGLRALAYGPIVHGGQVGGALVLGTFDERFARTLVEQMPGIVSFSATSSALLGERMQARREHADLRHALEGVLTARAFHPVFQPIVDLESGETVGYEALTRFDSGQRPDFCFADAWSVGLGPDLEIATLEAAIGASKALPAGRWVDLNLSPRLLADAERLSAVLWPAERPIVLEITEHEVIEDYDTVRDAITALGHDVRLAVDDAGAGVANFGHIIELRPDFVKLDMSLVRRVNANLGRQAMVVGMRHFSRTAGCRLVDEGIETEEEARTLRALGVEFGQGYHFGRPGPAADWTAVLPQVQRPSDGPAGPGNGDRRA